MDALALLCNLHAEGPLTLQRLRRSGCESLEALLEMELSPLAELFEGGQGAAERFQREAELLAMRLEGVPWGEEGPEEEDELEEEEGELELELDEELEDEEEEEEVEVDEEEVERVLDTWRDLDRAAPPAKPTAYVVPHPRGHADLTLAAAGLEGLTPALERRLEALDVRTVHALIEAVPLQLAGALGLPYTRVRHLQFLARRARERHVPPVVAVSPASSFSPGPPAPDSPPPGSIETAGPFA